MVECILEGIQKEFKVTIEEFERTHFRFSQEEIFKTIEIAAAFNKLSMVKEFREMSQDIVRIHDREVFLRPCQYRYLITKDRFGKSFANFLKSFEFFLLYKSTEQKRRNFFKVFTAKIVLFP